MPKIIILGLIFMLLNKNIVKGKELFEDYYEEAELILRGMTLDQKIGQLFFPRFNKDTEDKDITNYFPGGYVLFGKDFADPTETIVKNINHIQELSYNTMGVPLGLAVDEEGGTVCRVSIYSDKRATKFPAPQDIYAQSGIDGILSIDQEKRDLLRKHKLNVNLAPVADVSQNKSDFIYWRTLGKDAVETASYIKSDVEGYVNDKFSCCNKHFPGYGNNIDTHGDIARDYRPYEQFQKEDFLPFQAAINANIPMILVSHNIVYCKDSKYPASLSINWHRVLRNELGFTGLILTDDLSMGAIKKFTDNRSPAVVAILAGNDVLLTSDFETHLSDVKKAIIDGEISQQTIFLAARRIIAWKLAYLK